MNNPNTFFPCNLSSTIIWFDWIFAFDFTADHWFPHYRMNLFTVA